MLCKGSSCENVQYKITLICLERKWAKGANSRILQRSFENEMARYSPNFKEQLQIMVEMGKEWGFPLNFDMPRPFDTRTGVTVQNGFTGN